MIIESVQVKHFRSVLDETLQCENLTALVGANGAGKSTFLRALEAFYTSAPRIDLEDFYNHDISSQIVVVVTFKNLSDEAKELFSAYLQGEKLTVERVFSWNEGRIAAKYHGSILQNPEFQPVRDGLAIKDRGATAKQAYNSVRAKPEYAGLPAWSTIGAVESSLRQWEAANHLSSPRRQ